MTSAARTLYRYLIALFALGVVAQFFLAGVGAFRVQHNTAHGSLAKKGFEQAFDPHVILGSILLLVGLLAFLTALAARPGRNQVLLVLALPVLVVLQSIFAHAGPPWFRGLHVVVALVILGLAGRLAAAVWRPARTL
jgi:hypothetical protein